MLIDLLWAMQAYSLGHSYEDCLIAAEAPDSLMGHKTCKPKYG